MDCFFLFDFSDGKIVFHAEYCTERAVHTVDGSVDDTEKLYSATGTETKEELLSFLAERFSANNGLFPYLKENGIGFSVSDKSYADTSSDV